MKWQFFPLSLNSTFLKSLSAMNTIISFRFCFDAFSVEQIEMVEMVIQMFSDLFPNKKYVNLHS